MKVIIILCSIVILFCRPVDSRLCYVCSCYYDWTSNTGSCSSTTFQSSCTLSDIGDRYCSITSAYTGSYEQRSFAAVTSDAFQDSHFFQAVETISYSGTTWLSPVLNEFIYGCDWDGCNINSLSEYFPEAFQMNINHTTLNSVLLNGQSPAQNCYTCEACINQITGIICRTDPCNNGSCYIDEVHNYSPSTNCTFNFYSMCLPFIVTPYVRIRATYYIDLPSTTQFEIDEVDITCTKDFCNSIEVVENLKGQIENKIEINPDFQPTRPVDTTTSALETTASTIETTTDNGSTATKIYFTFALELFGFLLLI